MVRPRRANVGAAMIAHGAEHPPLQLYKGHAVGESADVQFSVAMAARIAATDKHAVSTVTSHVGQRHGLAVEQKVRVLNPRPITNAIRFTQAFLLPASKKGTKPL
jgi:hypothetical protein